MSKKPHPLEDIFNIEAGTTPFEPIKVASAPVIASTEAPTPVIDCATGELVPRSIDEPDHDREERIEDLHIDKKLETIHDSALSAFEKQARIAEEADPRFSARNAEVAAQYLKIALDSVNSRVDAKHKRQKVRLERLALGKPSTINNTAIFADRNDVLRSILGTTGETAEPDTLEAIKQEVSDAAK